jgi:hypothetical protein
MTTDFIEASICLNCKNYNDGRCMERHTSTSSLEHEKVEPDYSCSFFDEKPEMLLDKKKLSIKRLKAVYERIKAILKEFMDLKQEYYSLIAIWIMGTYFHKKFPTYPYLYFNAMKGSGKTRILKLIASLTKNGKLAGSMTEAVLFRTASERTVCIDEFENLGAKEKGDLRLLLNSAYKRGVTVERARRNREGGYDIEEFEVYCPIAIANIWGMESVLADRCTTIILERSSKTSITKLIENFENNPEFQEIKSLLSGIEIEDLGNIFQEWNSYQKYNVNKGINGSNVSKVIHVTKIQCDMSDISDVKKQLYNTINNSNLQGRDLELFFPLFIMSHLIGKEVLKKTLKTAQEIVKIRKESDREENRDVQLLEFIAQYSITDFVSVSGLANELKDFLEIGDEKWLNSRWVGRGLRRLNLVLDKRRTGKTRQVKLNIEKAKEKLKMFKES